MTNRRRSARERATIPKAPGDPGVSGSGSGSTLRSEERRRGADRESDQRRMRWPVAMRGDLDPLLDRTPHALTTPQRARWITRASSHQALMTKFRSHQAADNVEKTRIDG